MKKILVFVFVIFIGNVVNGQWVQLNSFSTSGTVSSIVLMNDTMIISGTDSIWDSYIGTYISTNHGFTWSSKNTSLRLTSLPLIKDGNSLYAGTWGQGVFLSSNKGNSWTAKNNGILYNLSVTDLIANNNELFVTGNGGFYNSTNGANLWQSISGPFNTVPSTIIKIGNKIIINAYIQNSEMLFYSTNNGINWTNLNFPALYTHVNRFSFCNNILLASNGINLNSECLYVSSDTGNTWVAANGLNDHGLNFSYSSIAVNGVLYVTTENGVYKSTDNGLNWMNTGLINTRCLAIIGDTIYAGTRQGLWKRSISEIATITPVNISTQPTDSFMSCATMNNISIAVGALGLTPITYQWQYKNGSNWTNVTNGIPSGAIYMNSNTDTLKVSGIINAGLYQYRCYLTNYNGLYITNSNPATLIINSIPLPSDSIIGLSTVSQGQSSVIYSIPPIPNATSYLWTLPNGASGTSTTNTITVNYSSSAVSGNITVKGINSCGIGDSSSLYVTVNPFIPNCSAQFDLVADTAVLHHYFVVNNASGVAPLHYNWSWGDGTHDSTAYPSHSYSAAGYYKICLTITDSVGCTVTYCDSSYLQKSPNAIISVQVIPQGTLGISSLLSDKIKIYPNPAEDNLIIELAKDKTLQNTTISIYNIQGQLLLSENIKQSQTILNIAEFAKGIYLIKVRNDSETFQGKFVKE